MGCVYIICCTISKKVYVGKTSKSNLVGYLKHNVSQALKGSNSKPKLYRAIRKYGPENFLAIKLFESENEQSLFGWEKYYIKEWNSNDTDFGYNISSGGEGSGYKHGPNCKHCLWAKTEGAKLLQANRHKRVYPEKKPTTRKGWSPEQRKAASDRMKIQRQNNPEMFGVKKGQQSFRKGTKLPESHVQALRTAWARRKEKLQ
jgi:group I intron endonuclease